MKSNIKISLCDLNFNNYSIFKNLFYYYMFGFFLSLCLTIVSFLLVFLNICSHIYIKKILLLLLFLQVLVQIKYFLHLEMISKKFWNILALLFILCIISILFFGTIWIMHNLKNHFSYIYIYI